MLALVSKTSHMYLCLAFPSSTLKENLLIRLHFPANEQTSTKLTQLTIIEFRAVEQLFTVFSHGSLMVVASLLRHEMFPMCLYGLLTWIQIAVASISDLGVDFFLLFSSVGNNNDERHANRQCSTVSSSTYDRLIEIPETIIDTHKGALKSRGCKA